MVVTLASVFAPRSPWANPLELFVFALILSYPVGLASALAAGVTHALVATRLRPALAVPVICITAVVAMAVPVSLIGRPEVIFRSWDYFLGFVMPPVLGAAALASVLLYRQQSSDRTA
ncbi:hypothetical protein N8I74_06575 [Chitiniphilus purpureus]|uniref:Uncharacterized protein n=1 Tax=Chitiniphilus purpureus TaxID=2981137 RepID=A0ABY6DQN1_9NEIS|nr:hypothetical protein [Chitiniphilus sp. CD1]UXY16680.1 hypothetical protein N8I74_06575 [Chitiniphilus sp. CD1]